MVDITTWFQLGTVGMFAGTLAMGYAMRRVPREEYRDSTLLVGVGAIAFVAYLLMSFGIGAVESATGESVFVVRYIDWLLTTPMHVAYLGLLAGVSKRVIGELVGAQALTILLGLGGALVGAPVSWALFLLGSLAFARVLYLLYRPITDAVRTQRKVYAGLYRTLLNFIAVLWLLYPVIWMLSPSGTGLMDLGTTTMVIVYIDVVAKVGFGLIALNGIALGAYLESGTDRGAGGDPEPTGEAAGGD